MIARRVLLALAAALATLAAAGAHGAKVDWTAVKPFDAREMKWLVVDQTNNMRAMFGIPDSDGALLWFDCVAKKSVSLTYVDHELTPFAGYHLHLKAGERTVDAAAKAGERLQLDDLVFLTTAPIGDEPFLANLKKGDRLTVVIDSEKQGHLTAFSLPGHGGVLAPFFNACGL